MLLENTIKNVWSFSELQMRYPCTYWHIDECSDVIKMNCSIHGKEPLKGSKDSLNENG